MPPFMENTRSRATVPSAVAAWQEQHSERAASRQWQRNTCISQTTLRQRATFSLALIEGCEYVCFLLMASHFQKLLCLLFWISYFKHWGKTLENQGANGWWEKKWTWCAKSSLCECCNYYILTRKCAPLYLSHKRGERSPLVLCAQRMMDRRFFRGLCASRFDGEQLSKWQFTWWTVQHMHSTSIPHFANVFVMWC